MTLTLPSLVWKLSPFVNEIVAITLSPGVGFEGTKLDSTIRAEEVTDGISTEICEEFADSSARVHPVGMASMYTESAIGWPR